MHIVVMYICFSTETSVITSRSWYVHSKFYRIQKHCFVSTLVFHFTEKKHQHDTDDDPGIGSSISTETKSTTLSEVSCFLCFNCSDMVHIPSLFFNRIAVTKRRNWTMN